MISFGFIAPSRLEATAITAKEETDFSKFSLRLHETATIDDESQSVAFRLDVYKRRVHWGKRDLFKYFADKFCNFSPEDFRMTDGNDCRELYDLIQSYGVYVPKGWNILIPDALYTVVQEDMLWPSDEEKRCMNKSDMDKTISDKRNQ